MPRGKYVHGEVHEPDYSASHAERMLPLMEQGLFNAEIAAQFGIALRTFYMWREEREEFRKAYEIGRPKRFAWWLTIGRTRLEEKGDKGYKFWVTIMNNMFSEEGWTSEYSKNSGTQINIGSMNVLQHKSEPELLESIKANFVKLNDASKAALIESKPELKEYAEIKEEPEDIRSEETRPGIESSSRETEI